MVERSDSEQFDFAAITDSVSTTNAKESGLFNTGEVAFACAFVNNHNQLQLSDPLYGKQGALEFFKDDPFLPNFNTYPETKRRKFRNAWFTEYK
ncbi:hypothetical protein NPIL_637131 [Nephila pilipes]|uniref:Uncharacterized protein n=1 Tax=Nephila pilipes TaxID=299642 RepID=A0A8X6NTF0_NEPPI|nr:hypothetical protein NPIL_637131 [Nephila pilipes]